MNGAGSPDRLLLEITPTDRTEHCSPGSLRIRLVAAGQAVERLVDFPRCEIERLLAEIRTCRSGTLPAQAPASLGRLLSEVLFPFEILEAFKNVLDARSDAQPVRLILQLGCPSLTSLPWELAAANLGDEVGAMPLALHPRLRVSRWLGGTRPALCLKSPLRVLVAWADPSTPAYPSIPGILDEANSIVAALQQLDRQQIRVHELPDATPQALRGLLRNARPDVFHFIGHGERRISGDALVLQGLQEGDAELLYGDELAELLTTGGQPVALTILSACDTAAGLAGIAELAVQQGAPGVIAMQFPWRAGAAPPFSRTLYAALAGGDDASDAIWKVRQAAPSATADWAVPVLYQSSELRVTSGAPLQSPPRRFHLPYPPNPQFTGREVTLARIHRALMCEPPSPVVLAGMAGMGKSQTAIEYAHRHSRDYPGGIFWVSARDQRRFTEELAALGRFFDLPEELPPSRRSLLVRDALHALDAPSLLVVDNVTEATELSLCPNSGACRVLATTRTPFLFPAAATVLRLPALDAPDAVALLARYRKLETPEDGDAARELAERVGWLPLALEMIGHHARRLGLGYGEYLRRERPMEATLEQARIRWVSATGHDGQIFGAIHDCWEGLSPAARGILPAAACFAGRNIPRELLRAAAAPESEDAFETGMADLVDHSFAFSAEDRRLTVHELVRIYVQSRMAGSERRDVAARVAGILTQRMADANAREEWHGLEFLPAHCRAAADICRVSAPEALPPLLVEIGVHAYQHDDLPSAAHWLSEASGLLTEDSLLAARCADALANVYVYAEKRDLALRTARKARGIARRILAVDDPESINFDNTVGWVLKVMGKLARARPYYVRALMTAQRLLPPDDLRIATCLNYLGMWCKESSRPDEALEYLTQALEVTRLAAPEDHPMIALRLNNIGLTLAMLGNWDEARDHHLEALRIYRAARGELSTHTAMSLFFAAKAALGSGDQLEARRLAADSLAILEGLPGVSSEILRRVREFLGMLQDDH